VGSTPILSALDFNGGNSYGKTAKHFGIPKATVVDNIKKI